jgi:hypothetical protein
MLPRLRAVALAFLLSLAVVRPAAAVDFSDIWWNPLESGWGVNFIQSSNFIFATFFIYGPGSQSDQPFWVTAQMNQDSNGVWSGKLFQTTGTSFGQPWNQGQQTTIQVGTATFVPTNSYSGTLTYNVGGTTVTKQIQRQTLTTIPLGGAYSGAVLSTFSNCTNPGDNGSLTYFANIGVAQTTNGPIELTIDGFVGDSTLPTCTIAGNYVQNGVLYRIPNASYACYTSTSTVQVSEIKSNAQGIEGQWSGPVGNAFPGCVEQAYFSALFIF